MPANASQNETPLSTWALDREIVLSRVINAPRELVFSAWADPRHLPQWFGPAGFRVETKSMDIRVNGEWRFDMIAPDGKRYSNRMQFRRIERPHLIEIDHGADKDNDPGIFRTTITFDKQSDGKTVITLRQLIQRSLSATQVSDSARSNSVIRPSTSWRSTSKAARLLSDNEQIWYAFSASGGRTTAASLVRAVVAVICAWVMLGRLGTTAKDRARFRNSSRRSAIENGSPLASGPSASTDLRHLHAVEYVRAGGSLYDLQDRLGHESITTTESYRKFFTPEERRAAKYAPGTQKRTQQTKFAG